MPRECAAGDCKELQIPESPFSFHRFPKDADLRKQWALQVNREHRDPKTRQKKLWMPADHDVLCSRHFKETDFTFQTRIAMKDRSMPKFMPKLEKDSVPTIFDHNEAKRKRQKEADERRSVSAQKRQRRQDIEVIAELLAGSTKSSSPVTFGAEAQTEERERKFHMGGHRKVLVQDIVIVKPEASTCGNITATGENINTRSRQKDECCVKGCSQQRPTEGSVKKRFFPFPREDGRCKLWVKNCGRQELMEKSPIQLRCQGFKICRDHFEDSQFQYSAVPTSQRLIPDAVPTLFKKSRRPGSKSSKPKEIQKKSTASSGGQLRVKMSSLLHPKSAVKAHRRPTAPQNAEQTPEIKLEIDYAEDPALHWTTPQTLTEVPPEGGGDGETATTVQSLTAAGHIKVEPMDTHADTVPVSAPPTHIDSELLDIKAEPQDIKTEPQDIRAEPQDIKAEPQDIEAEPQDIKAEPQVIKAELQDIKAEPQHIKAEPQHIKTTPGHQG